MEYSNARKPVLFMIKKLLGVLLSQFDCRTTDNFISILIVLYFLFYQWNQRTFEYALNALNTMQSHRIKRYRGTSHSLRKRRPIPQKVPQLTQGQVLYLFSTPCLQTYLYVNRFNHLPPQCFVFYLVLFSIVLGFPRWRLRASRQYKSLYYARKFAVDVMIADIFAYNHNQQK